MDDWEKKLTELYVVRRISGQRIAQELGWSKSKVFVWLEKYGIQRRTYKEACAGINKGKLNPMYGKSGPLNPMYGRDRTEWAKTMSGENHPFYGLRGPQTSNWKPPHERRSTLYNGLRSSTKYSEWRLAVFARDEFTCQHCGDSQGGNLNADHIKQFAQIIKENRIKTLEQGFACKELWDLDNGRTLCEDCHKQTETFGRVIG